MIGFGSRDTIHGRLEDGLMDVIGLSNTLGSEEIASSGTYRGLSIPSTIVQVPEHERNESVSSFQKCITNCGKRARDDRWEGVQIL